MNENNNLKLQEGSKGMVLTLSQKVKGKFITVFLPTNFKYANAKVLDVNEDGSVSVHWKDNFNTSGDFRTELMQFDNKLVMDNLDFEKRNAIRTKNGLIPIK